MVQFVWCEEYSVGNETIDEQHKYLIGLGNSLHTIQTNEDAQKIVKELLSYSQKHFNYEEKHMEEIGFSGLKAHQEEHAHLVRMIANASALLEDNHHKAIKQVRLLLVTWIIDHILYEDMKYFNYAHIHAQDIEEQKK